MEEQLVVRVNEGQLEGFRNTIKGTDKGYTSFLGVPYAEPPLGPLRFKAPVGKKPWTGIKEAKSHGSPCIQCDQMSKNLLGSEDCLFLNIHTPSVSSKNLPVMVFFHGGGFANGCGDSDFVNPESLLENDIVYVSINYRLGVFGFLSLDSFEVPGNAGLKDQNLALKWVNENIHVFGGNPKNITIFGISAGSASVDFHIVSPLSKGLFHKAILQSGSTINPWARTRNPSYINKKLLKALNIDGNQKVDDIINSLQAVEAFTLLISSIETLDDTCERYAEIFSFVTVVEKPHPGAFLDKEPIDIFKSGQYNHVPCIIGYCENEGLPFKGMYKFVKDDVLNQNFLSIHPKCLLFDEEKVIENKLKQLYIENIPDKDQSIDEYLSDLYFVGGIYTTLKLKLSFNDKVYLYKFQYDGNLNLVKRMFGLTGAKGALHGDDTSYVGACNYYDESNATESDLTMRKTITKMWTNFAKYENPTPEGSEFLEWKQTDSENLNLFIFDRNLDVGVFDWHKNGKGAFWEETYLTSKNKM